MQYRNYKFKRINVQVIVNEMRIISRVYSRIIFFFLQWIAKCSQYIFIEEVTLEEKTAQLRKLRRA